MTAIIGTAGIPLVCKGRGLIDGLKSIKSLELNALEVQLIRGLSLEEDEAKEIGNLARKYDITMSVHAPYYMNLALESGDLLEKSMNYTMGSGLIAHALGAPYVVIHPGFYGELSKKKALELVTKNVLTLRDEYKSQKLKQRLVLEISGKQKLFGSLDEIITVCKDAGSSVVPALDFSHIHARCGLCLETLDDFHKVFSDVEKKLKLSEFYIRVSGSKFAGGNEIIHTPIKKSDLKVDLIGECIAEKNYDAYIIANSPILEHDALHIKSIIERHNGHEDEA